MPDHDETASRAADRAALILSEGKERGLSDSAIAAMILADAMNEVLRLNIGSLVMTVREIGDRPCSRVARRLRRWMGRAVTRYEKQIVFLGQRAKVACDGNCAKAWGLNSRPRFELSDDRRDRGAL